MEKSRTAQKLKQLLTSIFDVAAEDYDIKSPMAKIELSHHEQKKSLALTKAEEKQLVQYCIARPNTSVGGCITYPIIFRYAYLRIKNGKVV